MKEAFAGTILALDLASTTGFAVGAPGNVPVNGSIRFAKPGHSMAAHFAGCRAWLLDICAMHTPRLVVFEGPLAPSYLTGKTSTATVRALMGLIAVVECTLHGKGYDVREASPAQVRQFFLGTSRYKRHDAKIATFNRCVELGWKPQNNDAADAMALWAFQVSIVAPVHGIKLLPLFGGARRPVHV